MRRTKGLAKKFIILALIVTVVVSFSSCGGKGKYRDKGGLFWIEQEGKYGCINTKGEVVITPQFERKGSDFSESLASIRIDRKYGYIDTTGKIAINPQFENANNFSEGLASVRIGDRWGYVNKKGSIVINPQFDRVGDFYEGLAPIRVGDKWGFINKKGKIVINPQFDEASYFSEGRTVVLINKMCGYIDKKGKIVINPQFDWAGNFSEGLARVKVGDNFGYIDKSGKYAINPQFEGADDFSERLAAVKIGRKYGYIDKEGKYVINPQFDEARGFSEGLAVVRVEYKWGYINKKGEWLVKADFMSAGEFTNGTAAVMTDRRELAYIDKEGNYIWDPRQPEIIVKQGGHQIHSGRTFDFDKKAVGESKDEIFVIENDGERELELLGSPILKINGPDADHFKVVQQPASPVKPGSNTVFTLRFNPTSLGNKNAVISIQNSDLDQKFYIIRLSGSVVDYVKITMESLKNIGQAIEDFILDIGFAPQVSGDVRILEDGFQYEDADGTIKRGFLTPFYIKTLPLKDAWENPLKYQVDDANKKGYEIISVGKDGELGTDDDIIFANGKFLADYQGADSQKEIDDTEKIAEVKELLNKLTNASENYLDDLKKAGNAEEYAKATVRYAEVLDKLSIEINTLTKKYPGIMSQREPPKELKPIADKYQKIIMEIMNLQANFLKYSNDPLFKEAQEKLRKAFSKIQ